MIQKVQVTKPWRIDLDLFIFEVAEGTELGVANLPGTADMVAVSFWRAKEGKLIALTWPATQAEAAEYTTAIFYADRSTDSGSDG